jgi:hypothetical protein
MKRLRPNEIGKYKRITKNKGGIAMKNLVIRYSLVALAFAVLAQGCGTLGKLKGTEELVETSGDKPKLISHGQWYEEQGQEKHYAGFADQIHDLDIAIRSAEMEAKKHVIESIATELRVEGMRGQSGFDKEAVGRFFEDSQAWLTDNLKVSGINLLNTYWEKWGRQSGEEINYFYRGYAVVQISKEDYGKARMVALDRLIDKAMREKNREAEKAARDTKERLLHPEQTDE